MNTTRRQINDEMGMCEKVLREVSGEEVVKFMMIFEGMTKYDQAQIYKAWEEYYALVWSGEIANLVKEQAKKFKEGKVREVKEIAVLVREIYDQGELVEKPVIFPYDPNLFWSHPKTVAYKAAKSRLEQLRTQVDGVDF